MDFVLGLSCTLRKHDFSLVIMDRLSKMAQSFPILRPLMPAKLPNFISTKLSNYMASPKTVSDRDIRLMSYF